MTSSLPTTTSGLGKKKVGKEQSPKVLSSLPVQEFREAQDKIQIISWVIEYP